MPVKTCILAATTFFDFAELYRFLRSDAMRAKLTIGQVETLADIIDARLPADVALEQRTPKGTTYCYVDDELIARVNAAGRYLVPGASRYAGRNRTIP